ncbi:MAG: hypothetical protein K6G16_00045 [Lachnospiraceae bacterium]|nr:hypothetical protein [Lachnospiraceae bacterium]
MKKKLCASAAVLIILTALSACGRKAAPAAPADATAPQEVPAAEAAGEGRLDNGLFAIVMPAELSGLFETEITADSIYVYDKAARATIYDGFVFGISAYAEPSDYAGMPSSTKIGELTDKSGRLCDMILSHPTEIQVDPEQGADSYRLLEEAEPAILETLEASNGGQYARGAGTKGEDLYGEILKKHATAIREHWDASRLEEEDMSPMYHTMSIGDETSVLDRTGYIYYDVNLDGIDELFIGEIANGEWKGVIWDLYTMVDRKPAHVTSGWDRNRFFVCTKTLLCNEYSGSAAESGWRIYGLDPNSAQLTQQVGFKIDTLANEEQPWFISYDFENDEWESVTLDEWEDRKEAFDVYERFDYIPLSSADQG